MTTDLSSRPGNQYFAKKLENYTDLGINYNSFWAKAKTEFHRKQDGGTDQGEQHCRDVENNLWKLIQKHDAYFQLDVLYILSMASAVHDCAKTGQDNDHAKAGAIFIKEKFVDSGYLKTKRDTEALSYIVQSHSSGDFTNIPPEVPIGDSLKYDCRSLAAIFRLADMMSTCEERSFRYQDNELLNNPHKNDFLNIVRSNIKFCDLHATDSTAIEILVNIVNADIKTLVEYYVKKLNDDITFGHRELLQCVTLNYITEIGTKDKKQISLPYKFVLNNEALTFFDTLKVNNSVEEKPSDPKVVMSIPDQISYRLLPCWFINRETNVDHHQELLNNIDKGEIDPKFLYWSLTGTREYLRLFNNPKYKLPAIAHSFLENVCFGIIKKEIKYITQFIDLGVGKGIEANIIINHILEYSRKKLKCTLIDFSYHMLRIAANMLDESNSRSSLYAKYLNLTLINGDIRNLHQYSKVVQSDDGVRLFSLLGGTLGNFLERDLLHPIKKTMSERDLFLLGVDLISSRSDSELLSGYDNDGNRAFLSCSLEEVGFDTKTHKFSCYIDARKSEIPNSKTIISSFIDNNNKEIKMAVSTKYDYESLKTYLLRTSDFQIIQERVNTDKNYAIFLMRYGNGNIKKG